MPDPTRVVMDCRKYSHEHHCSLRLSGTIDEVLAAALQHAVTAHGHEDTPAFRQLLRCSLEPEGPEQSAA